MKERFDIDLDVADWTQILEDILTERATPLARPSLQTSFWQTEIQGQRVVVVFNHETLEMVTAITEEMWQERKLQKNQRLTSSLGDALTAALEGDLGE